MNDFLLAELAREHHARLIARRRSNVFCGPPKASASARHAFVDAADGCTRATVDGQESTNDRDQQHAIVLFLPIIGRGERDSFLGSGSAGRPHGHEHAVVTVLPHRSDLVETGGVQRL